MTLKNKNYLIFQITIPIVTFIVMSISHIINPPSFALKDEITELALVFAIYPTILFSIVSAISWKIWKGKNWYSLSIIQLIICLAGSMVITLLSYIFESELGFIIFLYNIDLLVYFPACLLAIISIGIIGQLCVK